MARGRGRRRGVRWLVGLLIVFALAWCGYWYAVSRVAEVVIERITSAVAAHGGSLSWTDQGIGGFPLSLDFRGSGLKFAYAPASLAAGINRVTASAPLYYPGRITAAFVGPVVFDSPEAGIAVSASWSAATGMVDVGLNGLSRAGGSIDGLALDQTGTRLSIRHLATGHADFAAAPAADNGYRITAGARDISLERSGGGTFPIVTGQLDAIALKFGSGLGTDPQAAIRAWARKGGTLQVNALSLTAGKFSVTASGSLAVDQDGLLSGDLLVSLDGLDDLPDIAEQVRPGSRDRLTQLVALVKPKGGGATPPIPVRINKGKLLLMGIVTVGSIPPLKL